MSASQGQIRLVVTDIDGTLVNPAKELTPRVIAAAERLRAAWRCSRRGLASTRRVPG